MNLQNRPTFGEVTAKVSHFCRLTVKHTQLLVDIFQVYWVSKLLLKVSEADFTSQMVPSQWGQRDVDKTTINYYQ